LIFENVAFNFSDAKPALRKINFQVVAGESIAVIGPSGAGKKRLLNLLPRFYDRSKLWFDTFHISENHLDRHPHELYQAVYERQ
jgi:ABC-type transport system involved in Fe-S cluster assembly fused permease/ATPase subunit